MGAYNQAIYYNAPISYNGGIVSPNPGVKPQPILGVYPWLNPDGSRKAREKPYVKDSHKAEEEEKLRFRESIRDTLLPPELRTKLKMVKNDVPTTIVIPKTELKLIKDENYEIEFMLLLAT